VGFFILDRYLSLMRKYNKLLLEDLFTEAEGCDVFSQQTNAPFFDGVLKEDLYHYVVKQIRGTIKYMSPEEYIQEVTQMQGTDIATQRAIIQSPKVEELLAKMQDGVKIDLPYLLYGSKFGEQEGRHRVMAAKEFGCTSIPVAVFKEVHDKEVLRLAIELERLDDNQAKEHLTNKGFKNVDSYPTVKFTLNKLLDAYDAPTEGSLKDKVGDWSDTFDGRGVSTLIKYHFNDYKDEMNFIEIYESDPDDYYLDKALDYVMGRNYDMLQFDEYRVMSKKIDLGHYNWEGKLPKRLRDYILTLIKQFQEHVDDIERFDLGDDNELLSIISELKHELPEFNSLSQYLQKMVYGSLRYDAIISNSYRLSFHTRKMRVAIGSKGATVAISNEIIIDNINEYSNGHEMLVKSGIVRDLDFGFIKIDDIDKLDENSMSEWFNKYGLDKIK
jgi:hypothetical protein